MRKNTQIEEKLIKAGLVLDSKSYCGKKSEKTLSYLYTGVLFDEGEEFGVIVELNAKRNKITGWGIPNIQCVFYNLSSHYDIAKKLSIIEEKLKSVGVDMEWDLENR